MGGAMVRRKGLMGFGLVLCFSLLVIFPCVFSDTKQPLERKKSARKTSLGSSAVFPVQGNVYPLGYYFVSLRIGNPPKVFDLDIDSGSDLTWVQCDAPCTGCTTPREKLYKPKNNLLDCVDPICSTVVKPNSHSCNTPTDQCDYEIGYADHGSSLGVLVKDQFHLKFTNGSSLGPHLAFGCGYDQTYGGVGSPPSMAGVLGLGNGKASVLSQLTEMGVTRSVVGHCLSDSGGFLFFGDDIVPSSGFTWTPTSSHDSVDTHYTSGPAELLYGGKPIGVKGLEVIFDSGSSYTYFNNQAYEAIVKLIKSGMNGNALKINSKDRALPICWKGNKAFGTVHEAKSFFTPLTLSFGNSQLQIPPESYLIVTELGNVCLGILNGAEVGLGNHNVVGDISMQGKIVIYDYEKRRIGWGPANCDRLSKSVDDKRLASGFGVSLEEFSTARVHRREFLQQ